MSGLHPPTPARDVDRPRKARRVRALVPADSLEPDIQPRSLHADPTLKPFSAAAFPTTPTHRCPTAPTPRRGPTATSHPVAASTAAASPLVRSSRGTVTMGRP